MILQSPIISLFYPRLAAGFAFREFVQRPKAGKMVLEWTNQTVENQRGQIG
jgi:hypothetical protein